VEEEGTLSIITGPAGEIHKKTRESTSGSNQGENQRLGGEF